MKILNCVSLKSVLAFSGVLCNLFMSLLVSYTTYVASVLCWPTVLHYKLKYKIFFVAPLMFDI